MSNDRCFLDLQGELSTGRQLNSSEMCGSLAMVLLSFTRKSKDACQTVSWGPINVPIKAHFPSTSDLNGQFSHLSKAFLYELSQGANRVAHRKLSLLLREVVPISLMLQPKACHFLCVKVLLATNEAMTINSCRLYGEQLVFQTWN